MELTAQRENALAQVATERELRGKDESIHEAQLTDLFNREHALSRQLAAVRETSDDQLGWREKAEARAAQVEGLLAAVREEAAQTERSLQQAIEVGALTGAVGFR